MGTGSRNKLVAIVSASSFVLVALSFVQTYQPEIAEDNFLTMAATIDAQFVQQSNDFAVQLYKQVSAKNAGQNVVISPLSISGCLSLAAMGAGGLTAEELFAGLRYGKADQRQQVAESYGRLMQRLASDKTLAMANKLFVKEGYKVKSSFNEVATGSFQSEAQALNFAQNVESAKTINDWVEGKTNNKIKDLIAPDMLDDLTRMVLVNAVYFKGTWTYQFDPARTRPMPFWISATESLDVPMMNIKKHFGYNNFEDKGFSALELTYNGSDVTMLVLLPNERDGLAALEEKLPSLNLAEITSQLYKQEVEVFLPKFKIEFSLDLNDDLTELGMGRMFTDSAEFPELLEGNEPLKVSKVVHKAFIEVNEEGTEAAAATGMIMMLRCLPMHPYFTADHPFVYFLRHQQQIYFAGRMAKIEV
ncbi:serine protease inhibitor 42Dd-like isoform X1 [Anopheles aquasalis]|uniref:serine protease inhibitor 42Dd-like isoform X1 n=1 Tax=Anopheles aquasalis TaxID=42839 RepID=UPI00215B531B|nr:serine protease inhibitor 42Dd-like isoform X1 [Anopheles aquasalis]